MMKRARFRYSGVGMTTQYPWTPHFSIGRHTACAFAAMRYRRIPSYCKKRYNGDLSSMARFGTGFAIARKGAGNVRLRGSPAWSAFSLQPITGGEELRGVGMTAILPRIQLSERTALARCLQAWPRYARGVCRVADLVLDCGAVLRIPSDHMTTQSVTPLCCIAPKP
jgi:hypothetical protein